MRRFLVPPVLMLASFAAEQARATACDELVGALLKKPVQQALDKLGCSGLAKAGFDKSDHKVKSICYESGSQNSTLTIVATFKCATSGDAFFRPEPLSEKITASATVSSDCKVLDMSVEAAGELGNALIKTFGVSGKGRKLLQDYLADACPK